jgi:dTDP-4-dehydrorhamnose 3,5-epimerase
MGLKKTKLSFQSNTGIFMQIEPTNLHGSYEITLEPQRDERGYFMRTYDITTFDEHGLQTNWVQENQSLSSRKGIIRGLHFQRPPHAETKLIRVVQGAIQDVFVDLRTDSSTYGQWHSVELSAHNHKMAYVPRGFAHGFCTLTEIALVCYKVDSPYAPDHEGGIRWDDPSLDITWAASDPILSDKDQHLPSLSNFDSPFEI